MGPGSVAGWSRFPFGVIPSVPGVSCVPCLEVLRVDPGWGPHRVVRVLRSRWSNAPLSCHSRPLVSYSRRAIVRRTPQEGTCSTAMDFGSA